MSTSFTIERQNGNIPKSLPGEDHITGLVIYMAAGDIPASFKTERVQTLSTIDGVKTAGIVEYTTGADGTQTATPWVVRMLYYHLSEVYRINPAARLYVGIFEKPQGNDMTFAEIRTVQNFSYGRIRQIGVWCGDRILSEDDLVAIQGQADTLEEQGAELSVVYAPKVANVKQISTSLAGGGKCRVSVLIGQAGSGKGAELYKDKDNAGKASVSGLGVVLGLISKAKVHQCIASVKRCPTGITVPAFGDGTELRNMDPALVDQLDTARYLFFITQLGQSGSFMNDSHTMDSATSDYASIESVRTMDKAVRGIRTYMITELADNIYVDPETGKLKSHCVAYLETQAGLALEAMEKAGEISGYKVEIDPDQNVETSGELEIMIKNVASPVMRRIRIKIGFAKTV